MVEAVLHDSRVRKLSFTGSTEVGKLLLRRAADSVLSTSMELGGNAPFIVFDDADLEAAVQGAVAAKMMHGGEACIAANRFYVQHGVYERFAAMLAQRLESVRVGDGCESGTICGAMINQAAIDKINGLVDDAIARGAQVLLGGKPLDGPGFSIPRPSSPILTRALKSFVLRYSDRSRVSCHSTPLMRQSLWLTTPSSVWRRMSTHQT